MLLRPLPVANAERLYMLYRQGIGFNGKPQTFDGWAYPSFRMMRAAVKDQAELQPKSFAMLALPLAVIFATAFLAALTAVFRALRIDPVGALRSE